MKETADGRRVRDPYNCFLGGSRSSVSESGSEGLTQPLRAAGTILSALLSPPRGRGCPCDLPGRRHPRSGRLCHQAQPGPVHTGSAPSPT